MRQAVINMSYTNVSMLIAEDRNGRFMTVARDFVPFDVAGYSSGMIVIGEKGCSFLCRAVAGMAEKAGKMGTERIDLISTTLLRKANNPQEVKRSIENGTGMTLRQVTGYEEARALLVANERYACLERPLLINIGVSSIELSDYSHPDVTGMLSLPFGASELRNGFMEEKIPDRDGLRRMRDHILSFLGPLEGKRFENGVLTGRNLNAVWSIYRDWFSVLDGDECLMQRRRLSSLCDVLLDPKKGTRLIGRNCPEKMPLIIPAAFALKAIVGHFRINNMTVSPLGIKEGWLLMHRDGDVPDMEEEK